MSTPELRRRLREHHEEFEHVCAERERIETGYWERLQSAPRRVRITMPIRPECPTFRLIQKSAGA